jgi:hypothetical protein
LAPRRSWAKANNPFWSNHVATGYRSALEADQYCRKLALSTTSLMRWARHLLSADDLGKRAEPQRSLPRKTSKRQHKTEQSKRCRRYLRYRYGVRTGTGPVALQAFWGMHVEAMNFSGMGHAEYAAALGLSPHSLRIWRDRLEQSGNEMDWRSLLHPSARAQLSSAANCARCKYRLTPQEADGRSNRRRFTDEQKRAMVQETEKPGVAVADARFLAWGAGIRARAGRSRIGHCVPRAGWLPEQPRVQEASMASSPPDARRIVEGAMVVGWRHGSAAKQA